METKNKNTSLTGVILAGGKSQRMGQDKALLKYRGKPFIQHIAETLQSVFEKVIIISDRGEEYKFLNMPVYQDIFTDCGPLAGIHSAFVNSYFSGIFVVSTDLPLIQSSAIQVLINQHSSADVILFSVDNHIQSLFGLYNRSCLPILENHLKQKQYSVIRFLHDIHSHVVPVTLSMPFNISRMLTNINTLEDYQEIRRVYK